MGKRGYYKVLFIIGLGLLGMVIFFTSTLGTADISIIDAMKIVFARLPLLNQVIDLEEIKSTYITIVWNIRLPRIILSGLVGMGLSVVGAAFQGLFKNPMADPHVLGVSSGAALGATIAMIFNLHGSVLGFGFITVLAFIFAITTTMVVYHIARVGHKVPTVTLLLAGIAISFLLSSLISLMMIFKRDQVEQIVFWTMGSFSAASWKQVILLLPINTLGTLLIYFFSKDLNLMQLGDESAQNLGIEINKVKKILLIISSILVAASVSVSGIIGFVGLIIPHGVRLVVGPDHRVLLPFSILTGAVYMILCDTLARTAVPPMEIPVGAVTALFGAPYFIYLLYKSKKKVIS